MEIIHFQIRASSSPDPYTITVTRSRGEVTLTCTCAGAANGQMCKHRLGIIEGDASAILGDSTRDVHQVREWIAGSPLYQAVEALRTALAEEEAAKTRVRHAKRSLAAMCMGGKL